MTEQEKQLLVEDIKSQVIKELTGKDFRTQNENSKPLKDVYDKYRADLYQKFGLSKWHEVWEMTRKLAVYRMGKRYVRDLLPSEELAAAEFAESLLNQMLED